jgi:hypothetical protein
MIYSNVFSGDIQLIIDVIIICFYLRASALKFCII